VLKIRDNVDLKELEKFGFEYNNKPYYDFQTGEKKVNPFYQCNKGSETALIRESDKVICCIGNNLLYDLIKANLVEKVED